MPYFSPRSGTETDPSTEYVSELSSTAQEVRRILALAESPFELPESVKTLYTLLTDVMLNPEIPVSQILSMRAPRNVYAPHLFENMWTILFSLGVVPGFESVIMHEGKIQGGTKPMTRGGVFAMLKEKSIGTSSESGASDITFELTEKQDGKRQMVFCSSKYYKQEKSVDKYDIQKIIAEAEASPDRKTFDYRIIVLAKDKDAVQRIFNRALRTYLVKDNILGRVDLEGAIIRLRERVNGHENPSKFIENTFFADDPPRPFLELRFHQELIVEKTLKLMEKGSKNALWGVVARGGKTYMCAGLIRALLPKLSCVFIVLGAYTETYKQFTDELLKTSSDKGFQDFKDIEVIDVKNDTFEYDSKKKYVFVLSEELLKVEKKKTKKEDSLKERKVVELLRKGILKPELLFFDEIHKGGTTDLSTEALALFGEDVFSVYMTATYIKVLLNNEFQIKKENIISWDYEDIQKAKGIQNVDNQLYFEKKYSPELYHKVIAAQNARGNTLHVIQEQYMKFPDIQFLNTDFSPSFLKTMTEQNVIEPTRGFSMRALLATDKDCSKVPFEDRWKCLHNPAAVGAFLNFMGPAQVQMTSVGSVRVPKLSAASEHIMTRIGRASQYSQDILRNIDTNFRPHSQLWFLPTGDEGLGNLNTVLTCTASMLLQHPWFRENFSIVCVASGFKPRVDTDYKFEKNGVVKFLNSDDVKNTIIDFEARMRKEGEHQRGVIILAGRMLTLGVSLPNVNIVGLLDDSKEPDTIYQKMFRALTESPGKKTGYVVDMNPLRTINTLYTYAVEEKEKFAPPEAREHVDAMTLTQLYWINEDQFLDTSIGNRLTSEKLLDKITEHIDAASKSFKSIADELRTNIIDLDIDDLLTETKPGLNAAKLESKSIRIGEERPVAAVPSGIEKVKPLEADSEGEVEPIEPIVESDEKLRLALVESIQTATILLGILSPAKSYDDAIKYYKEDQNNIQDVVYDKVMEQGLFDEERSAGIPLREILGRGLSRARENQAVTYLKMVKRMEKAGGDQREVLDIMLQELKPKKAAKDKRGEVFTPPTLVEDMIDQLPAEILENPDLKWLDPANGIGNFPIIVFAKLDEALKKKMPKDDVRRKHILENMLYMNEIAPSNNAIARNLFGKMCGDPDCKLNIMEHDFLTMPIEMKFDVIIGNPPYNIPKGEHGSSGNSLWQNFVMKAETMLNPNGYICFIHPPGWKKPAEKVYKPEKFESGNFTGQIFQGQVWQHLRTKGKFSYIYVNDDRSNNIEELPNFPAVDYYVFKKTDEPILCNTRSLLYGKEYIGKDVKIDYSLPYIPNLITNDTIEIMQKLIQKEGTKPGFGRLREGKSGVFSTSQEGRPHKYIHSFDASGKRKYQYSMLEDPSLYRDKIVMTFKGGIDEYHVEFVSGEEGVGSYDSSMFYEVMNATEGKSVEKFFQSDIAKFMFIITQYAWGRFKQNEPLVANSITLPPVGVTDYYKFFGIEKHKPMIESFIANYSKKPEKKPEQTTKKTVRRKKSPNTTARNPAH